MSPMTLSRLLFVPALLLLADLAPAQKRAMTFDDVMRFRAIRSPSISEDGQVIVYQTHPDRGDDEVLVHDLGRNREHRIALGTSPEISSDGRWVKATLSLSYAESAKKGKDKKKPGLVLLDLESGEQKTIESVKASRFSEDGRWLAVHHHPAEKEDGKEPEGEDKFKRSEGSAMVLHELARGREERTEKVDSYLFDPESAYLVYAVTSKRGHNGLFYRALDEAGKSGTLHAIEGGRYRQMSWSEAGDALAFIHTIEDEAGKQGDGSLVLWTAGATEAQVLTDTASAPEGWILPKQSRPSWSKDGQQIFFGYQPAEMAELVRGLEAEDDKKDGDEEPDPFDQEAILAEREVDVWHWNDPLISTQQKNVWNRVKNQTYRAVYHRN
ncbi:MAG: TolB-like translocation protein, partial [Planctomycetota bacterium]